MLIIVYNNIGHILSKQNPINPRDFKKILENILELIECISKCFIILLIIYVHIILNMNCK
jgi:hypothetical protein